MKFLPIFFTFLVVFANIRVNAQRKVICYYANFAVYRDAPASYQPSNINGTLCTHIVYLYAILDETTLTIKPGNLEIDIDAHFYQLVNNFRSQGVSVSISLGFYDSGSKYSTMMATAASRTTFIQSVMTFIQQYNFNGLDLSMQFPSCFGGSCAESADKANFALLVKELSTAFKPKQYLLSAFVSDNSGISYYAYDIPAISQYLHWIGLMNIYFHSTGEGQSNYISPLGAVDAKSIDATVRYWLQAGAAPSKLIVGIPSFASFYTLSSPFDYGLKAPTNGPGPAGQFSKYAGQLAFYEVLDYVNTQGYTYMRSDTSNYAYRYNQWMSFEDVVTVRNKAVYINTYNLGGAMLLTIDLDDFGGTGICGKYPLLTVINQVLRNTGGPVVSSCFIR